MGISLQEQVLQEAEVLQAAVRPAAPAAGLIRRRQDRPEQALWDREQELLIKTP